MMLVIRLLLLIVLLAKVSFGQKADPNPALPSISSKTEEIPTPSGTPQPQALPDLLPESNQLPAAPPDLRLPSPSIFKPEGSNSSQPAVVVKELSPEEQEKNRPRLLELRGIASRNPRCTDLLNEANGALSDEAKREFMRAYYHTLCTRMRNLDASLGSTITAFERSEIRKLAEGPSHISIVSRDQTHRDRPRHVKP
jgi:hypothetical protein